ncbi:MAG TPA: DUF971 domain-containing protein [Bacteroidota bacterium]
MNSNPRPTVPAVRSFKQTSAELIEIRWTDGHQGLVSLATLRDRCPCAGCSGESILFESYSPPEQDKKTPGRYELKSASSVGNYALKIVWGDGHDLGIYSWEHIRSLCECNECLGGKRPGLKK